MSCNSKDSTLEYLEDKKIIDNRNVIIKRNAFNFETSKLVKLAESKYGIIDGVPFNVKTGIVSPNVKFFKSIDDFSNKMAEKYDNVFSYEAPEEIKVEESNKENLSEEEEQSNYENEIKADEFEDRQIKFARQEARYIGVSKEIAKVDKMILDIHDSLSIIAEDEKSTSLKGKATTAKRKIGKEIGKAGNRSILKDVSKLNALNYYNSINYYFTFLENQSHLANSKIKTTLAKKNRALTRRTTAYKDGQAYLSSFNLMGDVQSLIVKLHQSDSDIITLENFNELQNKFKEISKGTIELKKNLIELSQEILLSTLGNSKYFGKVYSSMKNDAEIRANIEFGNSVKFKDARDLQVAEFMNSQKEVIEERTREEFKKLFEDNQYDISGIAASIHSDANIDSPFIQIAYKVLLEAEDKYKNEIQTKIVELDKLNDKYKLTKTDWKKITEKDHKGRIFLIGSYFKTLSNGSTQIQSGFKAEYYSRLMELKRNLKIANTEKRINDAKNKLKEFIEKNTEKVGNKIIPIEKWKTNISNLSEGQIRFLEEFQKISRDSTSKMKGKMSLYHNEKKLGYNHSSMQFYEVPKMLETNFSKYLRGDLFGGTRKTLTAMFTKEVDDVLEASSVSMEEVRNFKGTKINWGIDKNNPQRIHQELGGKDKNSLNINYRNEVFEEQNMDLLTVYVKELENAEKYAANKEIEEVLSMLTEAVGSSKFYKTEGMFKKLQIAFGKNEALKNYETIEGTDSKTYKKLISMMENNVYEITTKYAGKIRGTNIDINRMTGSFIAYASYLGMALKIPGAVNNFFVGTTLNFVEQAGGEFTTLKSAKRAFNVYTKNFPGMLADIGKPFKTNYVNQIMNVFDIEGNYSQIDNTYERNSKVKQLSESSSLFGLYSAGEHEMQGTLTLSMLEGIKVLNKDGKFINKEGKEVKNKKDAASLLDMYYKDEADGKLKTRDIFTYTSIDYINKFDEGGRTSVKALLKDRIFRVHGIYDTKRQSDFQRNFYGKLFLHYKKYFLSAMLTRFRGMGNVGVKTEDLKEFEKYYNYSTKAEEYGYYTSFIRTIFQSIKKHKFDLIGHIQEARIKNKPLSEHQLSNIKKAKIELGIAISMIGLAATFVAAAGDDDDNDFLWKGAYYSRRLQNELTQYFIAPEMIRIAKNPIASIAQFNTLTKLLGAVISPFSWNKEYKSGVNAGRSKNVVLFEKAILPKSGFLGYDVQYKKMYNFFDSLD